MVQRLDGIPSLQYFLVARRLGPLPPIKGVGTKFVEYTAHPAPQDIQFVICDSIEQRAAEVPFSRRPAAPRKGVKRSEKPLITKKPFTESTWFKNIQPAITAALKRSVRASALPAATRT